jgi:hypothetical protein
MRDWSYYREFILDVLVTNKIISMQTLQFHVILDEIDNWDSKNLILDPWIVNDI